MQIMSGERVSLSIADGIARITFVNAKGHNAMDMKFCEEFSRATLEAEIHPDARVILITAEGDVFSPGGDINHFVAHKDDIQAHVLDMATRIHVAILSLARAPAPVIAAVNGMAAGGGFSLVAGCDVVIAKKSAKFNSAFTRSGFTPDAGGTYWFPRVAGARKAFWIMATNPTLTADQAAEIGLVSQVVDDDKFDAEVERIARQFADAAPGALGALKTLFRSSRSATLDEQLNAEARSIAARCALPETMARLMAFVEKKR
ncbi:MAG TPA: enoyl-CoA hydratase/isomerase family protein [Alphaproteobacteria bacterium]|nr:enoyl-CoA hydratase/isomerase family protein [Alphaproteobacteria bacterium]